MHSELVDGLQQSQRLPLSIAIESSTRAASLALARGDETIRYIPLNRQTRTAAAISVALDELLGEVRAANEALDFVAVANGPGSFTGLRVGVTTAKTLAYALRCPVVAVDSLAAMASALWRRRPQAAKVEVALDAYRGQLFTASWSQAQWHAATGSGDFTTQSKVVTAELWHDLVNAEPASSAIGAEPSVAERWQIPLIQSVEPTAVEVARLAIIIRCTGRLTAPMNLLPRYLRESAAEEKLTRD